MKNTAKRVIVILIFTSIIAAVLLYRAGAYDISFIKRPLPPRSEPGTETSATETPEDSGTSTGDTSAPPDTTEGAPVTEPPEPPVSDPMSDKDAEEYLNGLGTVSYNGLTVSTGIFDKNTSFLRILNSSVPSVFSKRNVKVTVNEIYRMKNQRLGIKAVTSTVKKPALSLYFGYVFVDQGKNYTVYSPTGREIATKFTGSLPFLTTLDGRPLVEINEKYYVLSPDGISSEPVGEDMINRMALAFDFPEYYPAATDLPVPYSDWLLVFNEIEPPDTSGNDESSDAPTDTGSDEPAPVTDDSAQTESGPAVTETEPGQGVTETQETSDQAESDLPTGVVTVVDGTFNAEPADTVTDIPDPEPEPDESYPQDGTETESFPTDAEDGDVVVVNGKTYLVEKKLAWGFKDAEGNVVVPAKYKTVYQFTKDGVASVISFEDEVIVVNRTGKEIFNRVAEPVKYSPAMQNVVKTHRRHLGAVNSDLSSIGMYYFDRGYCLVRYAEAHQKHIDLINISEYRLATKSGGYYTVPGNYSIVNYSDGIIVVEKDGLYGYFSIDGRWVSAASFSEARPFLQGLAVVRDENGKYGMINTEGDFILPMCFDYVSDASRGFVATWSETRGWELYCTVNSIE